MQSQPGFSYKLSTKFVYNILFLTETVFSIFSNSDIDFNPRGSKCNTNPTLYIDLLFWKLDHIIAFLSLVIVQKPFISLVTVFLKQYKPGMLHKAAFYKVWL
jgi:hypothetical protein